jgi:membrane protein DedA with SNARE-associated domain
MTHTLSSWIAQYGYLALAIGCLLEGETMLLLAGFAVHQGLMQWPWAVAVGAAAGCTGDGLLFALGRSQSQRVFARWPMLAERVRPRLDRWIERHAGLTVVGVRFAYGLRIAGPLALGTSSLPTLRFVLFNALGALLWATIFVSLGSVFGTAAVELLHLVDRIGIALLLPAGLVLAIVALSAWRRTGDHDPARGDRPR